MSRKVYSASNRTAVSVLRIYCLTQRCNRLDKKWTVPVPDFASIFGGASALSDSGTQSCTKCSCVHTIRRNTKSKSGVESEGKVNQPQTVTFPNLPASSGDSTPAITEWMILNTSRSQNVHNKRRKRKKKSECDTNPLSKTHNKLLTNKEILRMISRAARAALARCLAMRARE